MNKTLKQTVADLQHNLYISWNSFTPYGGITDITEFGKIRLMYNKLDSGHKARAKRFFDALTIDSRSKLPQWLWNYFYPDTVFKSFQAWKLKGRVVKKGEKSFRKSAADGTYLFTEEQTVILRSDYQARQKLVEAIYSANDDAPYDEDYDKLNKELQSWSGSVKKWDEHPLSEYEESMYYEYEPEY